MNSDQVQGKWKQLEGEVKRTWGALTDDDWALAGGDLDKLAGRIQERYGDAKEVVKQQLGRLVHRLAGEAPPAEPAVQK